MRPPTGPRALGARKMPVLSRKQLDIEARLARGETLASIARFYRISPQAVVRAREKIETVRSLERVRVA